MKLSLCLILVFIIIFGIGYAYADQGGKRNSGIEVSLEQSSLNPEAFKKPSAATKLKIAGGAEENKLGIASSEDFGSPTDPPDDPSTEPEFDNLYILPVGGDDALPSCPQCQPEPGPPGPPPKEVTPPSGSNGEAGGAGGAGI